MQINIITKTKTWQRIGLSAAALAISSIAWANAGTFTAPDADFNAMLSVSGVVHAGDTAEVMGRGFKAGQQIQLVQNGTVLSGKTPLVANDKGEIRAQIHIPKEAVTGLHPVVVQVSNPTAATVFELKVSPKLDLTGEQLFDVQQATIAPGLYQVAYSAKNNALFVTSSVGRPPVKVSQISKVDPESLKVIQQVTPAADPHRAEQVMAVYGVAVDDNANTVWVTNTRAGTVAVYDQKDLKLIKQFAHNSAPHGRDVVVDSQLQRAFVSSPTSNKLYVFDSKKLEPLAPIEIPSTTRQDFAAMSLSYDANGQRLYTVSRSTNELAIIDTKELKTIKTLALPGIKNASGVAVAADQKRVFVTGQSSDNVVIIDVENDKIIHNVAVGAGALNVLWDQDTEQAYIANRAADTLTVINRNGDVLANLSIGSLPNHLSTDGEGNVFLVNKARGQNDESGDQLSRLHFKK